LQDPELKGFGAADHDVHKAKAAAVELQNAKKEVLKRKWDLAVAKAKVQQRPQSTATFQPATCTFNQQLQQDLHSLLLQNNKPDDSETLFCLSLVDRLQRLPPKRRRKVQLEILQSLVTAEDEEETSSVGPAKEVE
jgi:hypothetical protein